MVKRLFAVCACLCLAIVVLPARGEDKELVTTARKTLQTYEKAVISLQAVLKLEAKGAEGSGQEFKMQCVAAVVDSSGIAVTSLTNLNLQGILPKIRRGTTTIELDCQVQEVKYRLADGAEVPARLVLKDEDLDLAFLAPQKPLDAATQAKIAVIPLADPAAPAELLDSTICIGRTDDNTNFIATLNVGQIVAVLSKPRVCYIANQGSFGSPAFNSSGKVLGLLCRCVKADTDESSMLAKLIGGAGGANQQYILPAADVAKLMPQVKEEIKKADAEKKPAAEKKVEAEKKPDAPKKTEK